MPRIRLIVVSMLAAVMAVAMACVAGDSAVAPSTGTAGGGPASIPELGNLVVEANVPVPMRDRVVLRADVYRPAGDGRHPVLVMRTPYGKDGCDTIEWAAAQSWSNGRVGTFGLSYPGAVQWLAAMQAPPHLVAMAPAMTFASARHFFQYGGAFNHDWMRWILNDIAPEERRRRGLGVRRRDGGVSAHRRPGAPPLRLA
jgi:predicted acyl esterase